jgi:O-antigen/teichoic acid export membrane protein
MSQLVKRSFLLSIGRLSASLARFLMIFFVARTFGKEAAFTAEYQKVWLAFNTTYMVFIFGIPASIYYFYPRMKPEDRPRLFLQSALILAAFALLYTLLLQLFSAEIEVFYKVPNLAWNLRIFSIYAFAMVASAFLEPLLNLKERFSLLASWMSLEALLFVLFAATPLYLGTHPQAFPALFEKLQGSFPDVHVESAAIHFSFVFITLLALVKLLLSYGLLKSYLPSLRPRAAMWQSMGKQLRWAFPITMTTMVAYLATYMDKNVVASYFADNAVYAVFQVGAMEVPFVSILVGSMSAVLLPQLSRLQSEGRFDDLRKLLASSVEKAAWLIFPLFALLMILADSIFAVVYPPNYAEAATPFRLYLLVFPLRLMFYGQVLNVLGKARWVFWIALCDLALNLGLSLILVRTMGMVGPAVATVVATIAELLVFIWIIAKTLKCDVFEIYRPRALSLIAGLSLLSAVGPLAAQVFAPTPLLRLVLGLVSFALIYPFLLWKGGHYRAFMRDEVSLES